MVSVGSFSLVQALIAAELRIAVLESVVEEPHTTASRKKLNIDEEAMRQKALSQATRKGLRS